MCRVRKESKPEKTLDQFTLAPACAFSDVKRAQGCMQCVLALLVVGFPRCRLDSFASSRVVDCSGETDKRFFFFSPLFLIIIVFTFCFSCVLFVFDLSCLIFFSRS